MKIHIIFATEAGTTKYVAEILQKYLVDQHHEVELYNLGIDGFKPRIGGYDLILFGSPTYYNGLPQAFMTKFLETFNGSIANQKVGVFALGDKGYPAFCGAAEVMEEWLKKQQTVKVGSTLKIDGYPQDSADITDWANEVVQAAQS